MIQRELSVHCPSFSFLCSSIVGPAQIRFAEPAFPLWAICEFSAAISPKPPLFTFFSLVGAQPTSKSRDLLCWLTPAAHSIYQTTTWLAMNPMSLFTVPRHSPGSCDGKELTKSLFLSARPPPDLYQAVGYRVDESPRSPSNKATIFRYRCAGSSGTPIGPAGWGDPLSDFDCRQSVVMARYRSTARSCVGCCFCPDQRAVRPDW